MPEPLNDEFATIDDLQKRLDKLAREVAAMPMDDPRRHQIISELTRLVFLPIRCERSNAEKTQPSLTFLTLHRII